MIWADWGNVVRTRYVATHTEDRSGQGATSGAFQWEMPVRVVGFAGGTSGPFLEPIDFYPVSETGLGGATKSSVQYMKKCHYTAPAVALCKLLEDWDTGEETPTTLHAFTGLTP